MIEIIGQSGQFLAGAKAANPIEMSGAYGDWQEKQKQQLEVIHRLVDLPQLVEDIKKIEGIDQARAARMTTEGLEAIGKLVLSLKSELPTFTTFFSDEVSGRIPTRILAKMAKLRRKELGLDTKVRVNFLTAGRVGMAGINYHEWAYHLEDFLKKNQESEGLPGRDPRAPFGKSLVVTEQLRSADSMRDFLSYFKGQGIDISLAAIGARDIMGAVRKLGDSQLFVGSVADIKGKEPELYIGEQMFYRTPIGVTKEAPPGRRKSSAHPFKDQNAIMSQVRAEHKLADLIARRMMPLLEDWVI